MVETIKSQKIFMDHCFMQKNEISFDFRSKNRQLQTIANNHLNFGFNKQTQLRNIRYFNQ